MRRSRRTYRNRQLYSMDMETQPLLYPPTDQSVYFRTMSPEERRRAAKNGWRNWFFNRGRIPSVVCDDAARRKWERRWSWRRVH